MKFFNEYTRTVLSEVAVAMSGRPLGFGIETQARDAEMGLKSARGRIRRYGREAIVLSACVVFSAGLRKFVSGNTRAGQGRGAVCFLSDKISARAKTIFTRDE